MAGAASDEFDLQLGWAKSEDREDDVVAPAPEEEAAPPAMRDTLRTLEEVTETIDPPMSDPAPVEIATDVVEGEFSERVAALAHELDEATRAIADVAFRIGTFKEDLRRVADRMDAMDSVVRDASVDARVAAVEEGVRSAAQKVSFLTLQIGSLPAKVRDLDRTLTDRVTSFEARVLAEIKEINVAIGQLAVSQEKVLQQQEKLASPKAATKAAAPKKAAVAKAAPAPKPVAEPKAVAPVPASVKRSWVKPSGDACPTEHPVKATLVGRWFRVPGTKGYDAAAVDRCYASETAARRAGFAEATD